METNYKELIDLITEIELKKELDLQHEKLANSLWRNLWR